MSRISAVQSGSWQGAARRKLFAQSTEGFFFSPFAKEKHKERLRKRSETCLQRKMAENKNLQKKNLNISWFEKKKISSKVTKFQFPPVMTLFLREGGTRSSGRCQGHSQTPGKGILPLNKTQLPQILHKPFPTNFLKKFPISS